MFWEGWSIRSAHVAVSDRGEFAQFPDRQSALQWLRRYRRDPVRMAEFRRLLDQPGYSTSHPRDDEIVLEQVAWAIHLGRLRMEWGDVREQQPSGGAYQEPDQQQPASSSTPPAPRPSHSATPSGPVLEEPTFPANLDALAIAQSQKEAARLGLPFCEECARMAAANARS